MKQFLKKRVENVSRSIKDDFEYITLESSTFFPDLSRNMSGRSDDLTFSNS